MTIFKHKDWENFFELDVQRINVLIVESKTTLWRCLTELLSQINGEMGDFYLLKNFEEQSIAKFCCIETDIFGLNLNSKKLQTALIKKCAERANSPEFAEKLKNISDKLYRFCLNVCQDVGYSIEIDDSIDVAVLFKIFSVSFKESFESLLDKLIEYINITAEFLKTKVCFFLFLSKLLTPLELDTLFEHCKYQGITLILVEDEYPKFLKNTMMNFQALIIDKDDFEIVRNFKESS